MKSQATVFHWKRRRSHHDRTAETSGPANCSLLPTWCDREHGEKIEQLHRPQRLAQSLNSSQAASSTLKDSGEHRWQHGPGSCCFFVHPSLLVPLLPPPFAFTNPCWPPTPSKKRRGLHDASRAYQAVSGGLSEPAAECRKSLSFQNVSENQPHRPQTASAFAQCFLRASAPKEVLDNESFTATRSEHCVRPCRICVGYKQGQHTGSARNLIDAAHVSHRREIHGNERRKRQCVQQTHCRRIEKSQCLVGGGHVFRCACCSPWLPNPSSMLLKRHDESGDGKAVCSTSFWKCIHPRSAHSEAASTSNVSAHSRGDSVTNTYGKRREYPCCRTFRSAVDAVSVSAEGCREKSVKSMLHGTALSIRRPSPACDRDGKECVKETAKQTGKATDAWSTSKRAPIAVESEGLAEGEARAGALTESATPLPYKGHVLFETLAHQKVAQGTSRDKPDCFEEGQTPHPRFWSSLPAHTVTCDSSETTRKASGDAIKLMKNSQAAACIQIQSTLPVERSSRVLYDCNPTSGGKGPALSASALYHDNPCSKPSSFYGSILLPSIGCGLTVAQSSLGRGSGLGVYALRPFRARSRVTEYSGLCVDRKVALLLRSMGTSTHVMRVGMQHQYLLGYRLPFLYGGAGAFVNDGRWYANGRRGPGVSARFQVVYDKKRARDRVYVVATRDIEAGEEIFTSYDNLYWALME